MQSSDIDYQQMINNQNLSNTKRKKIDKSTKNHHKPVEALKKSNKTVKDFQKKTCTTNNKSYFKLGESPFQAAKESSKSDSSLNKLFAAYDDATNYQSKENDAL